jgi:xylulokinase
MDGSMTTYLIGVDIGTQGTKTILYNQDGHVLSSSFEASNLIRPKTGEVYQEADEIFSSVINTVKDVVTRSGVKAVDIGAIGMDSQMAGIMGIGKDFEAVTYYDSWLDTKCGKYITQMKSLAGSRSVELNGAPVTYTHGPKILWWKNERPEIYKRIEKFVQPHVYVGGKLCGLKAHEAVIDYTCIHFSGFADNLGKVWSDELLEIFDVKKEKLPKIVDPWTVIGQLKKEYAQACGLLEGLPIVAGCGDSAATCLGAGIVKPGQVFDVAGTASILSCCVDTYKPDTKHEALMLMRSVVDGLWMPLAYINGGGLCLKWYKDSIVGSDHAVDYLALEREAEKVPPGSSGLLFIPHFAGRVCPNDPDVRGSFIGLNWAHSRGHLYRAIMEGIAYEYKYYLNVLKDIGIDTQIEKVFVMGGGAKSALFNQIKADVLGLKYVPLKNVDTAPLGSAIVAGFGIGVYDDIVKTAESFKKQDAEITNDRGRFESYVPYSKAYLESFSALRTIFLTLGGK